MALHASTQPTLQLATSPRRRRAVISLTPLIDVVFILLVFFMLTSSFLDWRPIELNAPGQAAAGNTRQDTLLIAIGTTGLTFNGEPVSLDGVTQRVQARLAETPDQRVMIKPAPGVALQRAVDVLDRLTAAGIGNLSLVRDPED